MAGRQTNCISWDRRHPNGFEVSSKGDNRFSAFNAIMPDGRSIEQWYQCDIKGYDPGGRNWRLGKGKPPLVAFSPEQLYELYLSLWRIWAIRNHMLMAELNGTLLNEKKSVLTDCFASTPINQARALAQILNEWFV